jgi:hypothetical protein
MELELDQERAIAQETIDQLQSINFPFEVFPTSRQYSLVQRISWFFQIAVWTN